MERETITIIESCVVQRVKDGEWENALLLNDGSLGLLDMYGQKIEEVWDYRRVPRLLITNVQNLLK
jgi:hypothetical protein